MNEETGIEKQGLTDEMRKHVAEVLPDALATAMASYGLFCNVMDQFDDTKEFAAHHGACKKAISHIEILLKLAKWVEDGTPNTTPQEMDVRQLVANATAELNKIDNNSKDE